jgi:PAS domain S-box-containing protein
MEETPAQPTPRLVSSPVLTELCNLVPTGLCLLDAAGRYVAVNDAYCRTYGYGRAELVGQSVALVLPPDEAEALFQSLARFLATGQCTIPHERRRRRKDGTLIWTQGEATLVTADDGRHLVLLTVTDITARKQAEEALRAQTGHLEALQAIGTEILRELDPIRLLNLILERALTLAGGESGTIWLWDETDQLLTRRVTAGAAGMTPDQPRRLGEGVVGAVARTRRGVLINEYARSPLALPHVVSHMGIAAVLSEPLLYRDRLIGVITLDSRAAGSPFSTGDQALLRLFATQAAIAIENARLHERLTLRLKSQEALARLSQAISSSLDLRAALGEIAHAAQELMGGALATFWMVDEDARTLTPAAYSDAAILDYPRASLRFGEGGVGWIAETRQTLNVPDRYSDPRFHAQAWARKNGFVGFLGVPVLFGERLLAVLALNSGQPFHLDPDAQSLLDSFVAQAATALHNAQLYNAGQQELAERRRAEEALHHRTAQLEALRVISAEITRELDLDALLGLILRRAAELLRAPAGVFLLWDEAAQILRSGVQLGEAFSALPRRAIALGEGLVGRVAVQRKGGIVNDYRAWQGARELTLAHTPVTATVAEPLLYRDRLIGVVNLAHVHGQGRFTPGDQELLRLFSDQAAIAIENARLFREEQRRGVQLQAVYDVSVEMAHELDLSRLLDLILARALQLSGAETGTLFLWDAAADTLLPVANHGLGDWMQAVRLRPGEGLAGQAAKQREGVRVADYSRTVALPPEIRALAPEAIAALHAALAEPLLYQEQLLGVLILRSEIPDRAFTDEEQAIVRLFAAQAAVAIINARLYQETKEELKAREEAEVALRESERFLADTQRIARLGGWKANPHTDELTWTAGVYDIIEAPMDYRPGLTEGLTLYLPEYIPRLRENVMACLETGVPFSLECEVRTLKGKRLWTEVRGLAPVGEGSRTFVVGTFQDITERKRLEVQLQQAQRLETVGRLAGGVAHDFNNLLGIIFGQLDLARMHSPATAPFRADLDEIQHAAERAADLTRQLLLFSRQETVQRRSLEVTQLLGNLFKMLRRLLGEHIRLEFAGNATECWVKADPGMLERVVTNLAVNARDSMPGGGRLTIVAEPVSLTPLQAAKHPGGRPGPFIRLTIQDTGHGIQEDVLPRIFDPFFSTKETGRGTGLGLATVHGIVTQHEGWIEVESHVGHGTTFQLFLPAIAPGTTASASPAPAIRGGSETLLVIEDEAPLRRTLTTLLGRLGYRVLEAETGPEALATWAADPAAIDLVVTDMVLPGGMTGLAVITRLRQERPGLPALLCSGYSSDLLTTEPAARLGLTCLRKPITPADLAQAIRTELDTQSRPRADGDDRRPQGDTP